MGRGETAALIAAAINEPARARQLLAQDPALGDSRYTNGETALHYLAIENQLSAVELLLECGCDPNAVNEFGDAPLVDAVVLQLVDMARLLLRYGANPNANSEVRGPVLHIVAGAGHAELRHGPGRNLG